jgi:ABC-2 type transport system permease protein
VPPLRLHVIKAIFERNFLAYYSSPLGYVFITLFILVSAAAAFWQPAFFSNNLAGLATLNSWMPYILLVFVPAITMNVWAEERRQGTDELLLTLPAGDLEIVLGKYLAALGIYTAALVFSTSLVGILSWLGRPDLGVVLATYLGYWLMGALMIAIGMVASILSSNVTIAFILGAAFSAIPVFFGLFGSPFAPGTRRAIEDLSLPSQFADFGNGVVPLVGIFYFVTLAAAMLYLNVVLLGRRHWAGGERSRGLGLHAVVRAISLIAALVSVDVLLSRYVNARWDWSSEGLHRLAKESARLISEIPSDRPVFIQAYYSEEVPRDYVQTKIDLLNKLREFAALGGDRIRLNLVPTEIYSEAAREAETRFGIQPRRVLGMESARQTASEIYLAVAFNSGLEEVVIPFFDRGLSVEYELTRAIRVVSRSARKKVGILNTDARLIGGLDFRSMNQDADWPIVTELRRQFEVSQVSPDSPIPSDIDVLLVAQPSSLTTPQIANLTEHVRAGKPTLIFVDPLPLVDPGISPELPKTPPGGMFGGGQQPEPKGSLEPLTTLLGIDWPASQIVFNPYSPHPMLGDLPPEVVFISRGGAGEDAFNESQSATSGLQEIVMMFPGLLRMRGGTEFIPLLRTGDQGGTVEWRDTVQQSFMGIGGMNPRRRHFATGLEYTLAARIGGKAAAATTPPASSDPAAPKPAATAPGELNVIVVADLDVISEQFFQLRARKVEGLDFDNVTFVLNCVDVLSGDESYVDLRKRRLRHRTLERIEAESTRFVLEGQKGEKLAESEADAQLAAAQKRLDDKVDALRKRTDLDERTKESMLLNVQEVENRRLSVEKTNIEDQKQRRVLAAKGEREREIRKIENRVRIVAMLVPPLPALALALVVFLSRRGRENRGANPNRIA